MTWNWRCHGTSQCHCSRLYRQVSPHRVVWNDFCWGKKMRRNHSLGSNTKRAEIFLSLRSRISSLPVRFFDRRKQRRYQRISPAHPFRKIISTSASALNCWKNISSIKIISFIFSLILKKMSFRLKKNLNDRESLIFEILSLGKRDPEDSLRFFDPGTKNLQESSIL